MTRKYYTPLCPYKILQKYFQGCLFTRISGSLCVSGDGFCFADFLFGRSCISWTVLGMMLVSLENLWGLQSQVWNWELYFESFPLCSSCDSQTQLKILHWLLETSFIYLRSKLPWLSRQVGVAGFPFWFWGWSWVETCLCWPRSVLE